MNPLSPSHRHYALQQEFLKGKKIQWQSSKTKEWWDTDYPSWITDTNYRVKPEEPPKENFPNPPHKHAALIKAWAEGAQIEYWSRLTHEWEDRKNPVWDGHSEYRIKPVRKPDIVKYGYLRNTNELGWDGVIPFEGVYEGTSDCLKFTWDGETGKLKSVEII